MNDEFEQAPDTEQIERANEAVEDLGKEIEADPDKSALRAKIERELDKDPSAIEVIASQL